MFGVRRAASTAERGKTWWRGRVHATISKPLIGAPSAHVTDLPQQKATRHNNHSSIHTVAHRHDPDAFQKPSASCETHMSPRHGKHVNLHVRGEQLHGAAGCYTQRATHKHK
jgi:hypothetical protein